MFTDHGYIAVSIIKLQFCLFRAWVSPILDITKIILGPWEVSFCFWGYDQKLSFDQNIGFLINCQCKLWIFWSFSRHFGQNPDFDQNPAGKKEGLRWPIFPYLLNILIKGHIDWSVG